MFCPKCGKENPDNANFCGHCRHELLSPHQENNDQPIPIPDDHPTTEVVSNQLKYGVLAATLVIPFVGFVMGIIYLNQSESEEKKSVGKLWLYSSIGIMVLYLGLSDGNY